MSYRPYAVPMPAVTVPSVLKPVLPTAYAAYSAPILFILFTVVDIPLIYLAAEGRVDPKLAIELFIAVVAAALGASFIVFFNAFKA